MFDNADHLFDYYERRRRYARRHKAGAHELYLLQPFCSNGDIGLQSNIVLYRQEIKIKP